MAPRLKLVTNDARCKSRAMRIGAGPMGRGVGMYRKTKVYPKEKQKAFCQTEGTKKEGLGKDGKNAETRKET